MTLPTDQYLTKYRLLGKRAKAREDAAFDERIKAEQQFFYRVRELGFCPACEKPFAECKCIAMAA